jgi:glycosyltransferase involved in cell wall biosynthesis
MKKGLISVIIPCYNAEIFISQTIDSVLNQVYSDWELIVVDDGSTDRSYSIVKAYTDERIKVFQQSNRGQGAASNFGLNFAQGEFVKFLDADDILNTDHLYHQYNRIKDHDGSIASCAWARFYNDDLLNVKFVSENVWCDLNSKDWILTSLSQRYSMLGVWLWLLPMKLLKKIGGWDERLTLNNDFEFSFRILTNVNFVYFCREAELYYRTGHVSLSGSKSVRSYLNAYKSMELGCDYILNSFDSVLLRRLCANQFQEFLFSIYPSENVIIRNVESKIHQLGGSTISFEGGPVLRLLSMFFGWKYAKKIKLIFMKMGYRKLSSIRF